MWLNRPHVAGFCGVSLLLMSGFAAQSQAAFLIYDSFSTTAATIGGTSPEIVQAPGDTWNTVNADNYGTGAYGTAENGSIAYTSGNQGFAKGYLQFDPALVSTPFDLSCDLSVAPSSGADVLLGYVTSSQWNNGEVNSGPFYAQLNSDGSLYTYLNGVEQTFGTSNSENIGLEYDQAAGVATFFLNGTAIRTGSYSGPLETNGVDTDLVGYKVDGGSGLASAVTFDNFTVAQVPEPVSLMSLGAVGTMGLLARRRRIA